jgi:hypothetical protein
VPKNFLLAAAHPSDVKDMLESASIWKNWTASEIPFSISMRCA